MKFNIVAAVVVGLAGSASLFANLAQAQDGQTPAKEQTPVMPMEPMPMDKMPMDKMPMDKMPMGEMPMDREQMQRMHEAMMALPASSASSADGTQPESGSQNGGSPAPAAVEAVPTDDPHHPVAP